MRVLLMVGVLFLFGCYEGWEYDRQGTGTDIPDTGEEDEVKTLLYVLFEPFLLSSGAMEDSLCFPEVGSTDYRSNEWAERIGSITTSLQSLSETVVVTRREVQTDDCLTMSLVEVSALDQDPWSPQASPGTDSLGLNRKIVHLKAVFWDEDEAATTPSAQVLDTNWDAFEDLILSGEPALSLHYFVMSSEAEGFLTEWRDGLSAEDVLVADAITTIDPSPSGLEARSETIASDTSELMEWILDAATF